MSKGSLPTLLLRVISTNLTRRQTSSNKHVHGVPPTSWLSTTITPPSSSSLAVLTYANKWRLNCCFHRSPALSILLFQTWHNITAQYESFLGFFRQQSVMLSWCSHLDPEEWKKYSCLFDYSDERTVMFLLVTCCMQTCRHFSSLRNDGVSLRINVYCFKLHHYFFHRSFGLLIDDLF